MAYSMTTAVCGQADGRFESALERTLGRMGFEVVGRATHVSPDARLAWIRALARNGPEGYTEPPSLSFGQGGLARNGGRWVELTARNLRAPRWNLDLARALSRAMGGWSLTYVNDRLLSEYGCGAYFAGAVIEAAIRSHEGSRSVGLDEHTADRVLGDEDENRRRFFDRLRTINAPASPGMVNVGHPTSSWELAPLEHAQSPGPDIEPETLAWLIGLPEDNDGVMLSRAAGVLARWASALHEVWPSHDPDALDEDWLPVEPRRVECLSLRGPPRASSDVLAVAARLDLGAVVVEHEAAKAPPDFWSRAYGGPQRRVRGRGVAAFIEAFRPLCETTGVPPGAFRRPAD